ncbi:MAG TPA: pyridoxal phosphate-dependent aminotransferase [Candidatus Polarisedimenticolaceae bacterium]|nr:pyridoxal phosphate-dependent aminotransferase [Candidatus Polarisedimenticolaceae bacterium]
MRSHEEFKMPVKTTLSERARLMPASPIRRLAPLAAAARKAGKTIYALNIGQPDIATPRVILDRLRNYDAPYIPYGPSQGLPEFIDALRSYYKGVGLDLATQDIFVTTAGSEAILFVLGALCDPGDEVLVFEPFYTNYNGFSAMVGVKPVPVTTRAEDGYHLPGRAAIEAAISAKTRAILICSPNNPTGTVYTDEEMALLASICRDRGIYLIADEVYREFVYDGATHHSALTLPNMDDLVVVVDSVSKRYSLCGVRIGNVVSRNHELMDALLRFGQARLCPPTLGQYACTALTQVPKSYIHDVIAEYERRRNLVFEALAGIDNVVVRKPEGAFYLCARLPVDDTNGFAEFLVRDFDLDGETVMIAPADGFYATPGLGKDEVRLAYVLEEKKLARAMTIFAKAIEAYRAR